MNILNHQSNGANGLRIAASVCVSLGWLAFLYCFIGGLVAKDVLFILPWLCGIGALAVMYLSACIIRGFASLVEAAQLYKDNNTPQNEYVEEALTN